MKHKNWNLSINLLTNSPTYLYTSHASCMIPPVIQPVRLPACQPAVRPSNDPSIFSSMHPLNRFLWLPFIPPLSLFPHQKNSYSYRFTIQPHLVL